MRDDDPQFEAKKHPNMTSSNRRRLAGASETTSARHAGIAPVLVKTLEGDEAMRRSIATVSLGGSLKDKFKAIAAAGFDAIELCENDLVGFDGSSRDLRSMVADLGFAIDLYQPLRDFESVPDALFRRNLARAEHRLDVMQELGAPMMLVCSNVSPEAVDDDTRAAAQLHELAERAARRNLLIGYEALAWGTHVKGYRHAWSIVRQACHSHLGLIIDSFHTLSLNDDVSSIAEIPGDKIFFVQLADAPRLRLDVMRWSRHFRCFPGGGHFDVAGFVERVLLTGYRGALSLEIFNDLLRQAPSKDVAMQAMQSLSLLEHQMRRRLNDAAPFDTPRGAWRSGGVFP